MSVYDEVQELPEGTEVSVTYRGRIRRTPGGKRVDVTEGYSLYGYLKGADSVEVRRPVVLPGDVWRYTGDGAGSGSEYFCVRASYGRHEFLGTSGQLLSQTSTPGNSPADWTLVHRPGKEK